MLRKGLVALICTAILSVGLWSWAATYYQIQTKLNTAGGWLQVRNNALQTASGSLVYNSFSTAALVPVTVGANPGYNISSLTRNGVVVPIGNYTSHYSTSFQKSDGATQALIAGFVAKKVLVTGSAIGPGSVTPASSSVPFGGSLTLTATPQTTSTVVRSITGGGSVVDLAGLPVALPYAGTLKINLTNINASQSVVATFVTVGATVGTDQTAMVYTKVGLSGTITGGGSWVWSQDSGPAVPLADPATLKPSFSPMSAGTYVFRLTEYLDGKAVASATTKVTVVDSLTNTMRTDCNGCHQADGIYPTPLAFTTWSTSTHKTLGVSCVSCHTYEAMPTPVNTNTVDRTTFTITDAKAGPLGGNYCAVCHSQAIVSNFNGSLHKTGGLVCTTCHANGKHNPDVNPGICQQCHTDLSAHPVDRGDNVCTTCHNPHSTFAALQGDLQTLHYNNMTTGSYPASYVTSRSGCTDCHTSSVTNQAIRQAWYTSGHARGNAPAWSYYDFKTMDGCVRCHTTTGFVAYSTGRMTKAWGVASDKTKELVTCRACHTDISTGALRTRPALRPYSNDQSFQNPDIGESNLCMTCHSGQITGAAITAKLQASEDFTNMPFTIPHYAETGSTMYGKGGYHFPGRTYATEATHQSLGVVDNFKLGLEGKGPCVACHRSGSYGHSFRSGVSDFCAKCHGTNMSQEQHDVDHATFANLLEVLRVQLAKNGFVYNRLRPHFNETNWGSGIDGANTQGAAFNYVLLLREPGAFGHNPQYAKQLALDSIDYLDNARFDDSVSQTVTNLQSSGAISAEVADSVIGYKNRDLCLSCHNGSSASASPMASNGHGAHLSGVYGPGTYLGGDYNSCKACHVVSPATHMNKVPDVENGKDSLCEGCHAGQIPVWSSTARIECTVCHAETAAVLSNGTKAPYKANFTATGHGKFAASNQCTVCHDSTASHISGSLGDNKRLKMANDNNLCAFCHNDAQKVGAAFLNMSTHVAKDGTPLSCRECHDPHGSANRSMIRSEIRGFGISFTDRSNGLIDPVSNDGLCQVCHTKTSHYLAGIPETSHFTSGCLDCHPHNKGFRPAGGSCDSCHGYPPAPKNTATSFGSYANWANARYEDYSGGGGAHLVAAHISPFATPAEGWSNCTVCHNGGVSGSTPYHKMANPVKNNIANVTVLVDQSLRFANGFTVYTGAKLTNAEQNASGSCFNIACHMSPSARWSSER